MIVYTTLCMDERILQDVVEVKMICVASITVQIHR